jgi:4-carboxymuconolactone decarboxylase
MTDDATTADAMFEKGVAIRDEMLGPEHGSAKLAGLDDFSRDLESLITRYCFGEVWGREQLPRDIRSMLTIAMLVAMGRAPEVRVHVMGAINHGVTPEQIREIMIHAAIYCGVPAAVDGLRNARAVLDELGVA